MAAEQDNSQLSSSKLEIAPDPAPCNSSSSETSSNKTSSSPVSHSNVSFPSTAMESAYNKLLGTIDEATKYRTGGTVHPKDMQLHIDALRENSEMLRTYKSKDKELSTQVFQLLMDAKRARRELELDLIDIPIEETKTPQPPELQPTKPKPVELPLLQIPVFNGDVNQFFMFRYFFEENILHNKDLTDTTRWLRLKKSLRGYPAELVSEFPPSGQALLAAWKILVDVYGRECMAASRIYDKITQLPPATLQNENLRLTHSKLEGLLMSLEHVGHAPNNDHGLRWMYLRKFPAEVLKEVYRQDAAQRLDIPLKELRVAIRDNIALREYCELVSAPSSSPSAEKPPKKRRRANQHY